MRVALIGATGLVGRALVPLLVRAGHEVHALQRRAGTAPETGARVHLSVADGWPALVAEIGPQVAVSCLGTTMRQVGSQAAFRAVDRDMVLAFAASAQKAGARHMLTVSSAGASERAPNFYLALKGEVERELAGLGFDRLDIFRPGLLRGHRGGERRIGERVGILVSPVVNLFLRGRLDRYAAINASLVARAMANALERRGSGVCVHENRAIRALASRIG